jgi:hypothetical protein
MFPKLIPTGGRFEVGLELEGEVAGKQVLTMNVQGNPDELRLSFST